MSIALYYSKYCSHCKGLLLRLSRSRTKEGVHFVCIDNRERADDGSTLVILDNGQKLPLPPGVASVPCLVLLHHGSRVLTGLAQILQYLRPTEERLNNAATGNNGEPLAFSQVEMGNGMSDNYSYLDMSAEELSAKGSGGLRIPHNYMQIGGHQTIATPPEDYVPNKIGAVDMDRVQRNRKEEVSIK